MRVQRGFSLIELLIVVAIIGIVAAIAVPALSRSRRAAEESSTVGTLRAYTSAQYAYFAVKGNHQYFAFAAELADGFIEPVIVTAPARNGYTYNFGTSNDRKTFAVTAGPISEGSLSRYFFVDDSGVIRYKNGSACDSSGTVLGSGT